MNKLVHIIHLFYEEIWNKRNFQVMKEIIHPEYHPSDVEMPEKGVQLIKMETSYFSSIFSNLEYRIENYAIKSDSEIWVHYFVSGIFSKSGWGFTPNNNTMQGQGIGIFKIAEGKIIDQKRIYSLYDIFTSCEAVPPFWELATKLEKKT